jgi:hypothetical protein
MDKIKNSKYIEYDNRVYSDGLREEVGVILSLHLEGEEKFHAFLQNLQESQIKIEPKVEREEVINEISNLLYLQIYTPETYSLLEFANKYQEYLTDIYLKLKNNNYESELVASNNLLYSYGLYQKYATDEFDEFVKEIRRIGVDISKVRKSLLPYSEFERWLFYHAYSLCYHEGMGMPDFYGVNDKIRSKPYGDGHLYPQNQIWQIVSEVGTRHFKGWRDYFCELAIIRYKKSFTNIY